ncbi:MAG: hypothetical protein IOC64_03095 [Methylobacterium sp.]|nr:hypothetical protein [Methylobacterium sp.]MCA3609817.1 hypothetical protein [Methylobacterium sp.]
MNLGDKSAIPAKALYSLADSFLPAQATISAGKIKTDSALSARHCAVPAEAHPEGFAASCDFLRGEIRALIASNRRGNHER